MTNEQAKQEAIRKAYEECGIDLGEFKPTSNNWSRFISVDKPDLCDILDEREELGYCRIRPKLLKNLDSNNGWIRIEPDGSNLPEKHPIVKYKALHRDGQIHEHISWDVRAAFKLGAITHYKPIKEEPKPIY